MWAMVQSMHPLYVDDAEVLAGRCDETNEPLSTFRSYTKLINRGCKPQCKRLWILKKCVENMFAFEWWAIKLVNLEHIMLSVINATGSTNDFCWNCLICGALFRRWTPSLSFNYFADKWGWLETYSRLHYNLSSCWGSESACGGYYRQLCVNFEVQNVGI